jgi:multidrug resistance efflux pump
VTAGRGWSSRVAWALCLALGASTAYYAYRAAGGARGGSGDVPNAATSPAAKSGSDPVAADGNVVHLSKGYIVPVHRILVSPKVNGMIVKLNIIEGKRVEKGELLAQIEDVDYKADVARAEATVQLMRDKLAELEAGNRPEEIAQARAERAEAEAQLPQMEQEFKRSADLRRKNIVTQAEFEQAESKYRSHLRRIERLKFVVDLAVEGPRKEKIAQARAELRQAEADVVKAKWRLGNCSITAPIRGTILTKNAEEGNIVNPIAFQGSYSLCEMADLLDMEVDLNIQERDVSRVHRGQKCKIQAEAYPDRTYEGVVSRLMPIADRAKGAVPVRVKITIPPEEEGVYLKPEMGALVSFLKEQPKKK